MALSGLLSDDPSRVGEFRLLGRLGAGGMGVVYLAEDSSGTRVAVKVLRVDFASDESFRIRFRREVAAARRVQGPCTARLIAADPDAEIPYFASEYIEGPTLERYCQQHGPLEEAMLRAFAVGVADAVWTIHGAGLVHRDLKPTNILLSRTGPKVIDFGITLDEGATSITKLGHSIGSPGWMAPEQARGERVDRAVDVFSWGAVVAYAATATPPFGVGSADAVIYRVVHEQPSLGDIDEPLRGLVSAALSKSPRQRPNSSQLVRVLLHDEDVSDLTQATRSVEDTLDSDWALAAATVAENLPGKAGESGRSRRRRLAIGLALFGLLVIGGVAAWVFNASGDPSTGTEARASKSTLVTTTTTSTAEATTNSPTPSTTVVLPTTTPAVPAGADGIAGEIESTLGTYTAALTRRDYPAAWAMLTTKYQANFGRGLDGFAQYWNTVARIEFRLQRLVETTGGTARAVVTTIYAYNNGNSGEGTDTFVFVRDGSAWRIDEALDG
jgi:serine/threonine protein kinase